MMQRLIKSPYKFILSCRLSLIVRNNALYLAIHKKNQ